jgi:hypothetical protein
VPFSSRRTGTDLDASGSQLCPSPGAHPTPAWLRSVQSLWSLVPLLLVLVCMLRPVAVAAAPGLCVGPVCGDAFTRSAKHVFQLRMRLSDQRGHHERITVDCRDGHISPAIGPVERGYGSAVARRACRLVGQAPA